MREIKFRAWDTQAKKWCGYEDTGPVINLYHSITHNCFMVDNDSYDFPNDLILCQYTGLNDHQGTEIYEGDIILWVDEEGGLQHYLVEWGDDDGTWWADGQWLAELLPVVTVVGNIHENRELLEAAS